MGVAAMLLGRVRMVRAALPLVFFASCATIPEWVDSPPAQEGYLYETGNFWGSLDPTDNEKNALKVAYTRLAHARETKVSSSVKINDVGGDRRGSSESTARSDVSITNAEHLETWRDVDGLRGPRRGVWVLVRIKKE